MQYLHTPPTSPHYPTHHEVSRPVPVDILIPIISTVTSRLHGDLCTDDQCDSTSENTSRRGPGIGLERDTRDPDRSYMGKNNGWQGREPVAEYPRPSTSVWVVKRITG